MDMALLEKGTKEKVIKALRSICTEDFNFNTNLGIHGNISVISDGAEIFKITLAENISKAMLKTPVLAPTSKETGKNKETPVQNTGDVCDKSECDAKLAAVGRRTRRSTVESSDLLRPATRSSSKGCPSDAKHGHSVSDSTLRSETVQSKRRSQRSLETTVSVTEDKMPSMTRSRKVENLGKQEKEVQKRKSYSPEMSHREAKWVQVKRKRSDEGIVSVEPTRPRRVFIASSNDGYKDNQCDVCGQSFNEEHRLTLHKRLAHPLKVEYKANCKQVGKSVAERTPGKNSKEVKREPEGHGKKGTGVHAVEGRESRSDFKKSQSSASKDISHTVKKTGSTTKGISHATEKPCTTKTASNAAEKLGSTTKAASPAIEKLLSATKTVSHTQVTPGSVAKADAISRQAGESMHTSSLNSQRPQEAVSTDSSTKEPRDKKLQKTPNQFTRSRPVKGIGEVEKCLVSEVQDIKKEPNVDEEKTKPTCKTLESAGSVGDKEQETEVKGVGEKPVPDTVVDGVEIGSMFRETDFDGTSLEGTVVHMQVLYSSDSDVDCASTADNIQKDKLAHVKGQVLDSSRKESAQSMDDQEKMPGISAQDILDNLSKATTTLSGTIETEPVSWAADSKLGTLSLKYKDVGVRKPGQGGSQVRGRASRGHFHGRVQHNPNVRPQCDQCKAVFKSEMNLQRHKKFVHTARNISCDLCDRTYKTKMAVATHKKLFHSENRPHQCHVCGSSYKTSSTLNKHMQMHEGNHKVTCDECGKVVGNLRRHKKDKHEKAYSRLECDLCPEVTKFDNLEDLKMHRLRMHGKRGLHDCPDCEVNFVSHHQLTIHRVKEHGLDVKLHPCPLCGKEFVQPRDLNIHQRKHDDSRAHKCDLCGVKFKTEKAHQRHLRFVHNGKREFVCEVCGKAFNWKEALAIHRRDVHSGVLFECQICLKRVKTMKQLILHQLCHEEPREECSVCLKKFHYKMTLQEHMKIHSEKGHFCPVCPKSFHRKHHLLRHIKTKHNLATSEFFQGALVLKEEGTDVASILEHSSEAQAVKTVEMELTPGGDVTEGGTSGDTQAFIVEDGTYEHTELNMGTSVVVESQPSDISEEQILVATEAAAEARILHGNSEVVIASSEEDLANVLKNPENISIVLVNLDPLSS